jgi:hypothetical protein
MANVPISNLTTTWNNVSTTFTGVKLNVTDTASASASLLMDLQVGGVSQFKVSKGGGVTAASYVGNSLSDVNSRMFITTAFGNLRVVGNSTSNLEWTSSSSAFGTTDLILTRDAANTLAQRNGVNAQTFRLYNTFTDASNYERLSFSYDGVQFVIGAEGAGTGSVRALRLTTTQGIVLDTTNGVAFRTANGGTQWANIDNSGLSIVGRYIQLTEQTAPAAPAANGVRIFAEDDGAGKTRLMARFATGAAVQIAIEP